MNALIPGSFAPITLGHVNIIERAAKIFDKVYVAVMNNDSAKHDKRLLSKTYTLDIDQRLELVKASVSHIPNVEALSSDGMLIDLCDEISTHIVVKGIRNGDDLEYEMIHAKWNKEHNPKIETIFFSCNEQFSNVSSTLVRGFIENKEYDKLKGIVSDDAIAILKNYYSEY
jgi:pantetheine-phosphate adenylyltransferase